MKSLNGVGPVRRGVARGLALGVLLGSAGIGMAVTAGSAQADPTNTYDLSAQGDGMYILVAGPNLPAGLPGPISPYASFAAVTSNAVSRGFAGAPYLGPLLQTLPGLVGGLSQGTVPPLPELPGYVTTQDPNIPEANQVQVGYEIRSKSDPFSSKSSAGVGAAAQATSQPQAFSSTETTANDDGTTVAKATAGATGINVGPISLLDVSSNVSITSDGKAAPTIVNTTNIGTISIAGIKVGLTESGFTILGSNLALPASAVFDTLNTVLGAAKTKIELLPSATVKSADGKSVTVQSGALRVDTTQDIPGVGNTSVTYIFGRSTVKSANLGTVGDSGSGSTTTTGDTTGGGATTAGDSSTGGTIDPTTGTSGDASGGVIPGIDPGATGDSSTGTTDPGLPPEVANPAENIGTGSSTSGGDTGGPTNPIALGNTFDGQLGNNTELLYLVLVLGGGAAFLGQQLFSRFGVRLMLRQT